MTTGDMHDAIKEGLEAARRDPIEYGEPVLKPGQKMSEHPNARLQLPVMKSFSMVRMTMNKSRGDKGLVTLTTQAPTAMIAKEIIDEMVTTINLPFLKKTRDK